MSAIFFFVVPILIILIMLIRMGKRLDFYEYGLLSSGSVLLSSLLYFLLYSQLVGHSAFDTMWNTFRQNFLSGGVDAGQILAFYHSLGFFQNFTAADQLAEYLILQMKAVVPAAILIFSLVYGVIGLLVIRLILKKTGHEMPEVRAFEDWSLPRGMVVGLIVLLLISLLGGSLGISNFEVVRFTITALISFLFTVIGLSFLWFFLKAGRVPSVLRWLLTVITCLIAGFVLPFLGMFDQLFHLRWRYRNKFLFKNGR
jgi:uncharacterized protein YybS (DUF2232 family)